MIFPKFNPKSFWSYEGACEVLGVRSPLPPLGMITLAAMLPPSWTVRLVNRNTEDLAPGDLVWADMVMTGGMLNQQFDALKIIQMAREAGKTVIVGGPDVPSSPHLYQAPHIRLLPQPPRLTHDFFAASPPPPPAA